MSVAGIAGIGKSRLSWEFFKYIDGIAELNLTHRGRCLAYGEGVTYWALAEMVRMRARITEGEHPACALAKLQRASPTTSPTPTSAMGRAAACSTPGPRGRCQPGAPRSVQRLAALL